MQTKSIVSVAVLSAFMAFSTSAWAGPRPGRYTGKFTRTASTTALSQQWTGNVIASNPDDATAPFSTLVTGGSSGPNSESLGFRFEVLANGDVRVSINGRLKPRNGAPVTFNASGVGAGEFTEHSFATTIAKGELSGPGDAKIVVFAGSPQKGKINVSIVITPKTANPLGNSYKIAYSGSL